MPRTTPLTRDELISAVASLRAATDLSSFAEATRDVLLRVFRPEKTWLYHLYDGRLHLPAAAYHGLESGEREELRDLIARVHLYDPVQVRDIGRLVHYSTEVYDWYRDRPDMTERAYLEVFHRIGMDWMLGSFHMDGDLLVACIGLAQPFDAGNFTKHDMAAMEALHPHLDGALKACIDNERRRRLGDAMAKAIEHHPSALFLLGGSEIVYANRAARTLMDTEVEGTHRWPLAARSEIARYICAQAQGMAQPTIPSVVHSMALIDVDDWGVDKGGRDVGSADAHKASKGFRLQLAVVNPSPSMDAIRVSSRERQVIETMAACAGVVEAAERLGIRPATLRVHLRNSYRKLEVNSLHEALALLKLECAGLPI